MINLKSIVGCATIAACALTACSTGAPEAEGLKSGLNPTDFDTVINKKQVKLYTLRNANGMEVDITNFGGRVVSIMVPDRDGNFKDVVLGFDNIAQYADSVNSPSDFGAAIGRYANRINKGQVEIEGQRYQLATNNFGHCLHGGPSGWQYQVYDVVESNDSVLKMTIVSPDGDNGFPGNVKATVTYTLTSNNALDIAMEGTTDKTTIINMTNHSYFNLSGDPTTTVLDQELWINSAKFTPSDDTYMTTGEEKSVEGTPMNFTTQHAIGDQINDTTFIQLKNANGYDHNWCLLTYKDGKGDDTTPCAKVYSPATGIELTVYTNEPGIQVYTGNFLEGKVIGKKGIKYPQRSGICLESQKYPDSPNKAQWPSPLLKPGEKYYSHLVYAFSVK